MNEWEQDKKVFVEKLSSADKTFAEIFNVDNESLVIQGEEREKLRQHYEANKKILNKLQSREFTVAVVGLEKAGKSTLSDALIKSMVLPEYSERLQTLNQNQMTTYQGLNQLAMGQQTANAANAAGLADLKYTVATENCADRQAISNGLRDVLTNNNTRVCW